MVLPARLRVQCQYGPCSCGGSAWQRQPAQPQRTRRCIRVPGSARPSPASWAAMDAARSCGLGDTVQSSHAGSVIFRSSFGRNGYMNDDVASYLARRKPACGAPAAAAAFARQVVAAAAPGNRDRAKCLLWAACKLAGYGISVGLEAVPGVLLHPSVIERFAAHAPGMSGAARRTLRTNLRFIARAVVPHLDPADAPLPRQRAKKPYTAAEIAGYLALADGQPTAARRSRAAGLVCLGAGAGLIRADLRQARGTDVAQRCGGVIVEVRGGRAPRAVPVLARYHAPLLSAAAFAGENFLTGGTEPERGNITNPLTRSLAGGGGLPPLDSSRLRATWLAECAQILGLATFLHAAGITCCQQLGDITAGLEPGSHADAITLLGGRAR